MPEDGVIHRLGLAEHFPGDAGPGLGVEQLHGLLLQLVQLHPVFCADLQLLGQFVILGAVVEDARPAGKLRVGAPALGQLHRLLLHAHDVGDALGPHHGIGAGPQLLQIQPGQIGIGAVQPVQQDVAIDGGQQVFSALPPLQQLPQPGGGDVHQPGQGDGGDLGVKVLLQIVPLGGEHGLPVLLRAAKGADASQGQDDLRLVPQVQGEEHVRAHEQPQLCVGIGLADGAQGVGGIALALPLQLQGGHLHVAAHHVGPLLHHGQPLLLGGRAAGQGLVGGDGRRDQQQLVQPQGRHRRLCRRHMPQVGGIKGSAVNSDLHVYAAFPGRVLPLPCSVNGPRAFSSCPAPERSCPSCPYCGLDDTGRILFR